MYFELKVFDLPGTKKSPGTTKIQFDSNIPFANEITSIIRDSPFEARRIRNILLHVANELIPKVVAREYTIPSLEMKEDLNSKKTYQDYGIKSTHFKLNPDHRKKIGKIIKDSLGDDDKFLKAMQNYIDKNDLHIQTTRFNFENANPVLTSDIRSVVNGDIPPPKKPKT